MYVTLQGIEQGLAQPIRPLRTTFASKVIIYKDKDGDDKCRVTTCSTYIPKLQRYSPTIDLLVFFHGHDTCRPHKFNPELVIQNFRLDDQAEHALNSVVIAVPSIFWKVSDSNRIRAAWSAAYINSFVEEVLDEIGKAELHNRPNLGRLVLAGHSGAYDILSPLGDQFDCGAAETQKGALAKLGAVVAMDTTYDLQHARALERWARVLPMVRFTLVLSKAGTPPYVWRVWDQARKKTPGSERPPNLTVETMAKDVHCDLPAKYLTVFI
jgi:hypothetical protein